MLRLHRISKIQLAQTKSPFFEMKRKKTYDCSELSSRRPAVKVKSQSLNKERTKTKRKINTLTLFHTAQEKKARNTFEIWLKQARRKGYTVEDLQQLLLAWKIDAIELEPIYNVFRDIKISRNFDSTATYDMLSETLALLNIPGILVMLENQIFMNTCESVTPSFENVFNKMQFLDEFTSKSMENFSWFIKAALDVISERVRKDPGWHPKDVEILLLKKRNKFDKAIELLNQQDSALEQFLILNADNFERLEENMKNFYCVKSTLADLDAKLKKLVKLSEYSSMFENDGFQSAVKTFVQNQSPKFQKLRKEADRISVQVAKFLDHAAIEISYFDTYCDILTKFGRRAALFEIDRDLHKNRTTQL